MAHFHILLALFAVSLATSFVLSPYLTNVFILMPLLILVEEKY